MEVIILMINYGNDYYNIVVTDSVTVSDSLSMSCHHQSLEEGDAFPAAGFSKRFSSCCTTDGLCRGKHTLGYV